MRIKGELIAYRCRLGADSKAAIDHFDKTGEFPPEGFFVYGIPKCDTLESQRAQQKRSRDRWDGIKKPSVKRRRTLHLRNATRRAQVERVGPR